MDARRLSGLDDRAILGRLVGVLIRYDLLEHPFGRAYARARYTKTGRKRSIEAFERHLARERGDRSRERTGSGGSEIGNHRDAPGDRGPSTPDTADVPETAGRPDRDRPRDRRSQRETESQ